MPLSYTRIGGPGAWHFAFAAPLAAALGYQAFMMFPYTFLARPQFEAAKAPAGATSFPSSSPTC